MNLALALLGALCWTLAEYVIHRFDGHKRKGWRSPFQQEHLAHHADARCFAPTWKKVGAAAVASVPMSLLLGAAFTVGFLLMYGTYEVIHRRIHTAAPLNAYGRWARKHHLAHHHGSVGMNFGVTSPIWDVVFRTHAVSSGPVRIPSKRVPVWLEAQPEGWPEHFAVHARSAR